ncbi:hypothetical protein [Streptomyces sp. NPDC001594]|uniref:hypothetical protein n=1 Tax=Streptomyces sp. NPDC001594 TaxID=3364590 RepID=UPI0036758F0C
MATKDQPQGKAGKLSDKAKQAEKKGGASHAGEKSRQATTKGTKQPESRGLQAIVDHSRGRSSDQG